MILWIFFFFNKKKKKKEDNFNKTMQDKKNWQLEKKMDIRRKYEQHYNIINLEKNAYPEKK